MDNKRNKKSYHKTRRNVPKTDTWSNRRKPYSVQNYTQQSYPDDKGRKKPANFDALGQNLVPRKYMQRSNLKKTTE